MSCTNTHHNQINCAVAQLPRGVWCAYCQTHLTVEPHEDGGATIHLPQGEALDRVSACVRCLVRGEEDDTIGDEAYALIWDGIVNTVVHERCIREGDIVRQRVEAR